MSEHEIFMARRAYQSRINHTRFRRKNLKAEKAERRLALLRAQFQQSGKLQKI